MSTDGRGSRDEELGMRTFEVRKEQAVERALERVRFGLGRDWEALSQRDIADLSWLLGELWSLESRAEWDALHFSKLAVEDVFELARAARRLIADPHDVVESLREAARLIGARG